MAISFVGGPNLASPTKQEVTPTCTRSVPGGATLTQPSSASRDSFLRKDKLAAAGGNLDALARQGTARRAGGAYLFLLKKGRKNRSTRRARLKETETEGLKSEEGVQQRSNYDRDSDQ